MDVEARKRSLRYFFAKIVEPLGYKFTLNAFIRIDPQNVVTLVMPMVEMGQGIFTAMAMLLAEELEVGLEPVRHEFPLQPWIRGSTRAVPATPSFAVQRGVFAPVGARVDAIVPGR